MAAKRALFRPPKVEYTAEIRWLLLRAYGPSERPFPEAIDAELAVDLACRFNLAPRIAARRGSQRLARDIGPGPAARFAEERLRVVLAGLQARATTRSMAAVAARRSLPLVLLKGAALQLAKHGPEGGRGLSDVDVLAPADRGQELFDAMAREGYEHLGDPPNEAHLPRLGHPRNGAIEIHRAVPHVRVGGSGWATYEALERSGLLRSVPELPREVMRPCREVLVAHALAHGLVQHGRFPRLYPMSRMFADLVDLGLGGPEGEALVARALPWTERDLAAGELAAARRLCRALASGDLAEAGCELEESSRALLDHLLAATLDPVYRRSLRLGGVLRAPTDRGRPTAWIGKAARLLFLSRAQIDKIYGSQSSWRGYLWKRLWRPLDLGVRLLRHGRAYLRQRART